MLPRTPIWFALMYAAFGSIVWNAAAIGVAATPVVLIGSRIGLLVGQWMTTERLRQMATVMLAGIGMIAVARPFLG